MSGDSLSPGAPRLRYNVGPFAVPNVTGTTGTVDCSAPGSCDDSALAVATPAGSGSTYTVRVSVSWPDSAGNFGVHLLLPAGRQVASAASSSDPEVMQVAGSPGSCTVRVMPSAPAGQCITADISLLSAPVTPAVSNARATGFGNSPAPEAIKDAHNAGEPSLGYDRTTDKAFSQSSLATYRVGFNDVASTYDGGATWKASKATGSDPVQRGSICAGGTTCGNNRRLLDFIDATVVPAGRVVFGSADGCTAACDTTTSPTSTTTGYRDALATIARQRSGLRIDAASGVVTRFLDGTTIIGDSPAITLAAGAAQRVDLVWKSAKKSAHTVTAVVDPANTVAESREDDNKSQAIVTIA